MMGEDQVRVDWENGKLEQRMACDTCGDKNVWGRVHQCCQAQCDGTLNALQAFPCGAWDDISAPPWARWRSLPPGSSKSTTPKRNGSGRRCRDGKPKSKAGISLSPGGSTSTSVTMRSLIIAAGWPERSSTTVKRAACSRPRRR